MKKEEAFSLYKAGHLHQAKEACHSFCKTDESDPEIWCLLAVINGVLELYEDAEQCGQRAIQLAPDYILALFNTALAQFKLEKVNAAFEKFSMIHSSVSIMRCHACVG